MSTVIKAPAGPFGSLHDYRSGFQAGLGRMLDQPMLGAFILVLANASLDPVMYQRFRPALASAYERWCAAFDAGDPRAIEAAPDDREVFERLRALGFDRLGSAQWRELGPWQLQFNPLRALRPARMSHAIVGTNRRPFDPDGFHFDKPFLRPEVLWEGGLCGLEVRLLYNKFPFAELHGLLVPEPSSGRPQYLDRPTHEAAWGIVAGLAEPLPRIGLGHNAYGAFASVNHLHFQLFVRTGGVYPIEQRCWRHNGGKQVYPLPVEARTDCDEAWSGIARRQSETRAFNLLYRPDRVYIVDRERQGRYRHSHWTSGFAWSEVAGTITLSDRAVFEGLAERALDAEFARMRP